MIGGALQFFGVLVLILQHLSSVFILQQKAFVYNGHRIQSALVVRLARLGLAFGLTWDHSWKFFISHKFVFTIINSIKFTLWHLHFSS